MVFAAAAVDAAAQNAGDTVVLSAYRDGDYNVRRVLVHGDAPQTARYDVKYAIGKSVLSVAVNGNAAELGDIAEFIDRLPSDTLVRVKSVAVTGYASPDGPVALNKSLAAARAKDFAAYLDKNYSLSKTHRVTTSSEPLGWSACRPAVVSSAVPRKQEVLAVLDAGISDAEKERRLKRMPDAWNYLKSNILPPMRRVDVEVAYERDELLTLRTFVRPEPEVIVAEETSSCAGSCAPCGCPSPCGCCGPEVEEQITGIIVEMAGNGE